MEKNDLLDFGFSPHDDMLEATFKDKGGFIHISDWAGTFRISGYYRKKSFDLGTAHKTIYDALDVANKWWEENKDKET